MEVDFVHGGAAYLPELIAYKSFLAQLGHIGRVHRSWQTVPQSATIVWWMCGRVSESVAQKFPSAVHVHEYASASVPPLAWCKDWLKGLTQATPDYRLFQNNWIRERIGFNDDIPFEYRDMGVDARFFNRGSIPDREFDGVYLGDMSRLLLFETAVDAFLANGSSLLLIGELPKKIEIKYCHHRKVKITGRVAHELVPELLRRCKFGLNLVPLRTPYTYQTSTKLLEYCAADMPVITTDYLWVRKFELLHNARFGYLPNTADRSKLQKAFQCFLEGHFEYRVPVVDKLEWQVILSKLHIWHYLSIARKNRNNG